MSKKAHSLTFSLKSLENIEFPFGLKIPQSQNVKLC